MRIDAGRLILEPVGVPRARAIVAGDLSGITCGPGWPHADTLDGLGMVAGASAEVAARMRPRAWLAWLDGAVIGDCGTFGPPSAAGDIEIGYGLAAPHRGRGLGTAMVAALSRALLAEDGVRRVVATTDAGNVASRRVLERAGFVLERDGGEVRYALDQAPSPQTRSTLPSASP